MGQCPSDFSGVGYAAIQATERTVATRENRGLDAGWADRKAESVVAVNIFTLVNCTCKRWIQFVGGNISVINFNNRGSTGKINRIPNDEAQLIEIPAAWLEPAQSQLTSIQVDIYPGLSACTPTYQKVFNPNVGIGVETGREVGVDNDMLGRKSTKTEHQHECCHT